MNDESGASLFDQGMSYADIVRLLERVEQEHGVRVAPSELLASPTIAHLQELIREARQREGVASDGLEQASVPKEAGSGPNGAAARGPRDATSARHLDEELLARILRKIGFTTSIDEKLSLLEQGFTSLEILRLLLEVKAQTGKMMELGEFLLSPTLATLRAWYGTSPTLSLLPDVVPAPLLVGPRRPGEQDGRVGSPSGELVGSAPALAASDFHAQYHRRRSQRALGSGCLTAKQLLDWLSCLAGFEIDGEMRHLYPSAGGTYSVQVYVEIRGHLEPNLVPGVYYYHPLSQDLARLSDQNLAIHQHFSYNRPIVESAPVCLHFVAERRAIESKYGHMSGMFTAVEAGAIIQLLMLRQVLHGLGSCVIAGADDGAVRNLLELDASQQFLLSMACGTHDFQDEHLERSPAVGPSARGEEGIAIVGMEVRLPGASTLDEFWENLSSKKVSLLAAAGAADELPGWSDDDTDLHIGLLKVPPGSEVGSRTDDKALTALLIDMVGRLISHGGSSELGDGRLGRDVGVFVGTMWNDDGVAYGERRARGCAGTYAPLSSVANQISHAFDWIGPSIVIDAGCSSSLSALAMASDSICQGRCRAAVVVGLNVFGHRFHVENLRELGLLKRGPCRGAFDGEFSGWSPGEGVGVLLLRAFPDAERSGDGILGVVLASATTSAGRTAQLGAPATQRQVSLMQQALERAGIDGEGIDYIELAAAGAVLSDASEFRAIETVFAENERTLFVGTLKPNIGHLESASGMAQIAKVLLQFRQRHLAPTILSPRLNPLVEPVNGKVRCVERAQPWDAPRGRPLRAMINGFGGTGTQACVLLESHELGPNRAERPIERDRNTSSMHAAKEQGRAAKAESIAEAVHAALTNRAGLTDMNIDFRSSFVDMGLSSLEMVRLVVRLESALDMKLPVDLLLRARNALELVRYLETAHERSAAVPARSPLSEGQKSLWALQRLERENYAYNCPICFKFTAPVDRELLATVCLHAVDEHPILGMSIKLEEHAPIFEIDRLATVPVVEQDISMLDASEVIAYIQDRVRRPIDPSSGPVFRVELFRRARDENYVLLTIHHVAFDGGSYPPLRNAVVGACLRLLRGQPTGDHRPETAFLDHIARERELITSEEGRRRVEHWTPIVTELLEDARESAARTTSAHDGQRVIASARISEAVRAKISAFASHYSLQPSVLMLGVFRLMLFRQSGEPRSIVGVPVDLRGAEQRDSVGFFVNVLPISTQLRADGVFLDFLRETQQQVMSGLAMAYPIDHLARGSLDAKGGERKRLFRRMFNFLVEPTTYDGQGLVEEVRDVFQTGDSELELAVSYGAEEIFVRFNCDAVAYEQWMVDDMCAHFVTLLERVLESPGLPPLRYPMLSDRERSWLSSLNATSASFPDLVCLHERIRAQAGRTPDAVALSLGYQRLSYRRLDERTNQIARFLHRKGVRPGMLVGVCMERSIDMVLSLLAVLKVGAAYVPIDPEHPPARVGFVVEDTGMRIVISDPNQRANLLDGKAEMVCLADHTEELDALPSEQIECEVDLDDLMYVIYTSGSTGRPKGCMLSHRAVANRIAWMQQEYSLSASDRVLQKTPFDFDVSVWELFWPLCHGAILVLAPHGHHRDPARLKAVIEVHRVTICHFVPSMLRAFLRQVSPGACPSLRLVVSSGESLDYTLCTEFLAKLGADLHNLYGPTEAAIDVTSWQVRMRPDKVVPIGRPIANCGVHVLGPAQLELPPGFAGELYISGVCLARGYLNRPELTAKRFVEVLDSDGRSQRLYRTGDRARWLADGNLEYLGRVDNQLKIRGFRVEPGEIEALLGLHPEVRHCAVVAKTNDLGSVSLLAYVCGDPTKVTSTALREFVAAELPAHMVPNVVEFVDELPLTHSGKVDRKALERGARKPAVPPPGPTAEVSARARLAGLWAEVLGVEGAGRTESFFDLGGHSLGVAALVTKIQDEFGLAIDQVDFHRDPTLAGLERLVLPNEPRREVKLMRRLATSRGERRLSLICVPYAGADAAVYMPLAKELAARDSHVDVYSIALPRESSKFGSVEEIASACCGEICESVEGELAVYGHCVGGFLALEIVRHLEMRGRQVKMLFEGAVFPFHSLVRYLPVDDPWRLATDEQLRALLKAWGARIDDADADVVRALTRSFRHDARLAFVHQKQGVGRRIAASIVNLVSADDTLTIGYRWRHRRWRAISDDVRLFVLPRGKHYFVGTDAARVADCICELGVTSAEIPEREARVLHGLGGGKG